MREARETVLREPGARISMLALVRTFRKRARDMQVSSAQIRDTQARLGLQQKTEMPRARVVLWVSRLRLRVRVPMFA